jgi:cytochrome d ubiquinol oxidase subunit I
MATGLPGLFHDLSHLLQIAEATPQLAPATDQPGLFAARQMQALSLAVHIPLVCFGVAFPAMVLFMEGLWLRTGDPVYKALAKRWSKVMLILFAVGVVTGTILSFEFGLLWPRFMSDFGEVFGLGFTFEGFSFFLEAIFIAIYVYGWNKFSPKVHLLIGIPVLIAGITGSLLVIAVNGWMNHPTGFDMVNGQVVNVDPWAALFNKHLWHEFTHMYIAAYMVCGFLVAGAYAWRWLRGKRDRYYRIGLVIPLTFAALCAPVQMVVGDWSGRVVAEDQPIKLAAFEGLADTTTGAPFTIGGIYKDGQLQGGIEIPKLLSILAYHDPNATVEGLNAVPADDRPPVNVVHYAFLTMVGIGTLLLFLGALFLYVWIRKRRLPRSRLFYWSIVASGPLAFIALISGWIVTEVGRQPWVVYNVMRTKDAVTDAGGLEIAYGVLVLVYVALTGAAFWLLRRLAARPPEVETADEEGVPA